MTVHATPRSRRAGSGIALTETLIALPVLITFLLCVLQVGLIYRARLTLEYAAHEAARGGALNNGMPLPFSLRLGTPGNIAFNATADVLTRGSVWQGLVRGMTPLHTVRSGTGGVFAGWLATHRDLVGSACIEYLNPTQTAFIDWGFIENAGQNRWMVQIPNDTLRYRKPLPYDYKAKALAITGSARDATPPDAELRGAISNQTLGESNVLHLRVHYGYRLGIPVANRLFILALQGAQYLAGAASDPGRPGRLDRLEARYLAEGRIPLVAEGVAGMETPMFWHPFYAFGPSRDRRIALQWDPQWNNDLGTNVLERPGDTMTNVYAFVRNNSGAWADQLAARGVDALGARVGDGNAFCPALWNDAVRAEFDRVPKPPGSAR